MKNSNEKTLLVEDLKKRLQWLMFFRVIIASFFLGVAAITQWQRSDSYLSPHLVYYYGLIGTVYFCTFIYVFLMPVINNFQVFAHIQIFIDLLLVTVLIYITGGINSIFSFMYTISIISASILLYISGGIIAASVSSLFYCSLVTLQHYNFIFPFQTGYLTVKSYSGEPLYFPLIVNASTFFLVAFLSSFIAEQGKKSRIQLQEKQIDVENLEAFNENIIQSINSGLLTLDQESRVITFNRAAQQITGLVHSQVYMKNIEDVFPNLKFPEHAGETDSKFANPRFETTFIKKSGKVLYLGFSLSILKDKSGNEIGKIIAFQDLTNFKEMQSYIQRMDRLAAVGRLAAGIAHEVRNPLASISGSIQVLEKSLELNDSDKRLMEIIIRESSNLSELISEFTQFARPGKLKKERFKLKHIVDEVIEIFKNSPECREVIRINQNIRDDIYVQANYQQVKQVLWNLMINAAQAINSNTGEISIDARIKEGGLQPSVSEKNIEDEKQDNTQACFIEIQIHDTGCGISKEDIDKIFDPFYTTKDNGTGLGLAVVHRIIQEHEGKISVDSKKEEGASFTIYLPNYICEASPENMKKHD